jgi:hypothetical protein
MRSRGTCPARTERRRRRPVSLQRQRRNAPVLNSVLVDGPVGRRAREARGQREEGGGGPQPSWGHAYLDDETVRSARGLKLAAFQPAAGSRANEPAIGCWRRATTSPARQPGARPRAGGCKDSTWRPLRAISQEVNELEFHISPAWLSSRPQTSVACCRRRCYHSVRLARLSAALAGRTEAAVS